MAPKFLDDGHFDDDVTQGTREESLVVDEFGDSSSNFLVYE